MSEPNRAYLARPEDLRAAVERWCDAKRFISDPAQVCDGPEYREVCEILAPGCSLAVVLAAVDLALSHRAEIFVPLRAAVGDGPALRPWEIGNVRLMVRAWRSWLAVYGVGGAR